VATSEIQRLHPSEIHGPAALSREDFAARESREGVLAAINASVETRADGTGPNIEGPTPVVISGDYTKASSL
jgi:hypothetical protein